MGVSLPSFLSVSGGALALTSLGVNLEPARAYAQELRIKDSKETTTVFPCCSVGCGILVPAKNGKVINTEGDPDFPIPGDTLF
ncbi:MAG: hypothetical protein ABR903_02695 [Thermodesulfovibrionales bacterium]|jgi:formate dehydrogenase major subunit